MIVFNYCLLQDVIFPVVCSCCCLEIFRCLWVDVINVLKHVHVQRWKCTCGACVVQTCMVLLIKYAKLDHSFCRRRHHTVSSQYWFMVIFKIFSEFTCIWPLVLRKSTFFSSWLHPTVWYSSKCAVALYQFSTLGCKGKLFMENASLFCFLMFSVCFSLFFSSPYHRQIPWKHIHWWRGHHHLRMRSHWISCP